MVEEIYKRIDRFVKTLLSDEVLGMDEVMENLVTYLKANNQTVVLTSIPAMSLPENIPDLVINLVDVQDKLNRCVKTGDGNFRELEELRKSIIKKMANKVGFNIDKEEK